MASRPEIAAPAEPDRKDAIASIAGQIVHLSAGDRAALRRIYLTARPAADGIVVALIHRAGVTPPETPAAFRPWRLLVHCAAILSGTAAAHPHSRGKRLGAALHAIGLSENRLLRLTGARGGALDSQVIRAARMLAQAGQRTVNLWTLFALVGNDDAAAEAARLRIAQDYYAADARSDEGDARDQ